MKLTIAFFGHRNIYCQDLADRLKSQLMSVADENEICCLIGTHGDFDMLALEVCRKIRQSHPHITITVVFTSLNVLIKGRYNDCSIADLYNDVDTMIYDIEEEYFKKQIIVSNRKMVDESDSIICYVDMKRHSSGAKKAVEYAMKEGKKVVNLFREQDRLSYDEIKKKLNIKT